MVDHEMRFLFPSQNAAASLQTEHEHESDSNIATR